MEGSAAAQATTSRGNGRSLGLGRKLTFGLGDFTVNTVLSSLNLVFITLFLVEIAELRPALAGIVPLVGRFVDAFTDPLMGRISDHTHWKAGRRRPYFLIGALPFALSFAMLWIDAPFASQSGKFVYYASVYILLSLSMTMLSVPYLALLPEMALGYDQRTSLNAFRNLGSVLGIFAAICVRPVANSFGGGAEGFALAGMAFGILVGVPWLAVYAATWERPEFQTRAATTSFVEGMTFLGRNHSYRVLTGLYLPSRVAMDLVGPMLGIYFTYWIGRSGDFEIAMFVFLIAVIASLPVWLRISSYSDKHKLFMVGGVWWGLSFLAFLFIQPDWPRWVLFAVTPLAGLGFAVVDLMPWAMIGEVVDEDELATGERREGLYNGTFTFVRKLAGALGVAVAMLVLDLSGFDRSAAEQSGTALWTIRLLTGAAPGLCVLYAVWVAREYPLDRLAHERIVRELSRRASEADRTSPETT